MAVPEGWILAGDAARHYEVELDRVQRRSPGASAKLRSTKRETGGFGTLMQTFVPERLRGRRVRLSGWVRCARVVAWSGLWMRVDGKLGSVLAFDNMQARPIRGSRGWARYEVVLDVAKGAAALAFGIMLEGAGTVWLDDVALEVVGREVASTDTLAPIRTKPRNLGFDE